MATPKKQEEIRLTMPWGHVAAKTWGSKSGSRVLVVHGTLDNAGTFDRLMSLLPDDFYYVAIDLPGHGLSSPMPQGLVLEYQNYVFAIRLVLDKLNWPECIYIGHSFGAQLGLFTSVLHPGRITRIACLDGFLPPPLNGPETIEAIRNSQEVALHAANKSSPVLYTKDEILYTLKNKRNFPLNGQAAEALSVRATTRVGDLYRYNRDTRLRVLLNPMFGVKQYAHFVKSVNIPALIVLAEWSWLDDAYKEDVIEIIKLAMGDNFKIVEVRGNHDVHNNNPEVVAGHVRQFLSDTVKSKL